MLINIHPTLSVANCVISEISAGEYLINSLTFQLVIYKGTNPAINKASQHAFKKTIMKTLSQQLKQAFNALEFANVSQLNELNARLNQSKRTAPPARTVQRKAAPERDTISITPSNSPCF